MQSLNPTGVFWTVSSVPSFLLPLPFSWYRPSPTPPPTHPRTVPMASDLSFCFVCFYLFYNEIKVHYRFTLHNFQSLLPFPPLLWRCSHVSLLWGSWDVPLGRPSTLPEMCSLALALAVLQTRGGLHASSKTIRLFIPHAPWMYYSLPYLFPLE